MTDAVTIASLAWWRPGRFRHLVHHALPVIGGMFSQGLLIVVDTLFVSRLGPAAVSAAALATSMTILSLAILVGISVGIQVMVARRKGECRDHETAIPLNGGLVAMLGIAAPVVTLLVVAAPWLLRPLSSDHEVIALGVAYLRVQLLSLIPQGVNLAFRAFWTATSRPGLFLRTTLLMHVVNIAVSYLLVFGKLGMPRFGLCGAAFGMLAAALVGAAYSLLLGCRRARDNGFLRELPSRGAMKTLIRLGTTASLQAMFVGAGQMAMLAVVARVGTQEVAAASVILNVTMLVFQPGIGLGLATAALVGHALGARNLAEAERWGWEGASLGMAVMGCFGVVLFLVPDTILQLFFTAGAGARELAVTPLRLAGATLGMEALVLVLLNSISGAGATHLALTLNLGMEWLVFLPIAYLVGPVLGGGLAAIWTARIGWRSTFGLVLAFVWRRRWWANATV